MERLTVADDILENGKRRCHLIDGREVRNHAMEFYWRLKEYEDLGLTPERIEVMQQHNHILIEQLAEYQRLEKQGLLLKLPCKVGDKIYVIEDGYMYDFKIDNIDVRKENGEYIFCLAFMDFKANDFGKIVFLSEEEAEAKLKEMEGES